jgi:pilus assembly protein Flp/PilA
MEPNAHRSVLVSTLLAVILVASLRRPHHWWCARRQQWWLVALHHQSMMLADHTIPVSGESPRPGDLTSSIRIGTLSAACDFGPSQRGRSGSNLTYCGQPSSTESTQGDYGIMKIYTTLLSFLLADREDDRGATVAEYALLVAGIAVVVGAAIAIFGTQLGNFFSGLGSRLGL